MSPSPGELDRFLDELRGHRQRLLSLVDGQHLELADLVAEVHELSEQLVVAEEELREGQEELEGTRRQVEALTKYGVRLFQRSPEALVLTDVRGVALDVNPAAADLVQQAGLSRSGRPFATWFDVADRARIRSLISHQDRDGQQQLERVLLLRSDGSGQFVDLALTSMPGPTEGGLVLLWQLSPADTVLQAVPPTAPARTDLAAELTGLASRMAGLKTVQATLDAMVEEAVRLVPGADQALVVEIHRRRVVDFLAGGDAETEVGPALAHVLTVPLKLPGFSTTQLRLRGARPLGPEAAEVAALVAVHFCVAMARVQQRENLEHAMLTRQLIGQAVGVLVERRRLTADAAFGELVLHSQLANLKLREVARIVVETGQDPEQIAPR